MMIILKNFKSLTQQIPLTIVHHSVRQGMLVLQCLRTVITYQNNKLKTKRMNMSSYGNSFVPINVQDNRSPTPLEINESFDKQKSNDRGLKMNPKIIETWINETLADAEHLDIPGVLLKPAHKNPISRYGVDKLTLTNAGIPNEVVDRIYRALFVYSIGFYELMNKALIHTSNKYRVITSIWKVYAVLLEYCSASDYRMLINELSVQHMEEMQQLDYKYQDTIRDLEDTKKIQSENVDTLQKYCTKLERDLADEKSNRMKLEEEFDQNSKNHEEEVQLRLKFESKLNNMHAIHRDVETKFKRALTEIENLIAERDIYQQRAKVSFFFRNNTIYIEIPKRLS
jgi:hypothetical protein